MTDSERINQLTVIPNETYETFVTQYQEEIKAVYGTTSAGAGMTNTHKGESQNKVHFKRNASETINAAFKRFWQALARKTDFTTVFIEENLINLSIEKINAIKIPDYIIEASSYAISEITENTRAEIFGGSESVKFKARFSPLDLIEELSENTGLSYTTLFKIIKRINNYDQFVKNPPRYIHEAAHIIRNIESNEMLRGLTYNVTGETFPFDFDDFVRDLDKNAYTETPKKGVFDKMLVDSGVERDFARFADNFDPKVVCFLKLPTAYKIKTPIGHYEPDWGLVMKHTNLKNGQENEFYFVIETKGTNDIFSPSLGAGEAYKIQCAMKHFAALGVEVHYEAPIKDYQIFQKHAEQTIFKTLNPT